MRVHKIILVTPIYLYNDTVPIVINDTIHINMIKITSNGIYNMYYSIFDIDFEKEYLYFDVTDNGGSINPDDLGYNHALDKYQGAPGDINYPGHNEQT
jgi:hypothetical protein